MPLQWYDILLQQLFSAGVNCASGTMQAMAEGTSKRISTNGVMARRAKLIGSSLREVRRKINCAVFAKPTLSPKTGDKGGATAGDASLKS